MEFYCQKCGSRLNVARFLPEYHSSVYVCSNQPYHCYLGLQDTHKEYPLQILDPKAAENMKNAPEDLLNAAFRRIKFIDHKTISIVYFEQTLLGVYQNKEIQIVRPD